MLSYASIDAPSTIYVGNGKWSGEYYDFFLDISGNQTVDISDLTFYNGQTYTFQRLAGINNHPFYLSDIVNNNGSYHYGTLSFEITSSASISQSHGIQDGESITFTLPINYTNILHYYCTVPTHTPMVRELNAAIPIVTDYLPDVVQGNIRIGLKTITSGLSHPIGLVDPNDGTERLFIFEQTGKVKIINPNGQLEIDPLMDISTNLTDLVLDTIGYDERGLLGFVLDSNFNNNGKLYFYASYPTNQTADFGYDEEENVIIDHHSVVIKREYMDSNLNGFIDGNDNFIETELLRFEQPLAESFPSIGSNHNGGHLALDNNGFLMVSIGDGGDRDDTGNGHGIIGNGQDPSNIWGTIIRIDPNSYNSINGKYGIPDDNPFVNDTNKLEEIFAYGFRNPWVFSQDSETDIIYTADSGQDTIQEINIVVSGGNYGWRLKEGSFPFDPIDGQPSSYSSLTISNIIDPIFEYDHDQGYANIIGGHVYRGSKIPLLQGMYICGDYGQIGANSGELFYLENINNSYVLKSFIIGAVDRSLLTDVRGFSFDAEGEIYFVGNGINSNSLFKIIPLVDINLSVEDSNINVHIQGDEESIIKLLHTDSLVNSSIITTNHIQGGEGTFSSQVNELGFFKGIAE